MNTQEIQGLIDTKIKGQGTNVDAGSALSPILTALNENVGKAVSPDSTDMSEEDQMQVRKNLGLYYETEQQTNTVNGTDEGEIYADIWKHISDDTPSRAREIVSVKRGDEEVAFSVDDTMIPEGYMMIQNEDGDEPWFLVIISPNSHYQGLPAGIYVATTPATVLELSLEYIIAEGEIVKIPEKYLPDMPTPGTSDAVQYIPQELTDAQKMQARKNQDLYYEEEVEMETPLVTDQEAVGGYYKVSAEYIPANKLIGVILNGGQVSPITNYTVTDIAEGYQVTFALGTLFLVLSSEYEVPGLGVTLSPGIYVNSSTYSSLNQQLVYEETTVHKIPSKYLPEMPSGGLEYYEIELVDWAPMELDSAELVGYTWQDIMDALYSGKLLVFTIKDRNSDDNQVRVKVIGGQLSRMTDIEGSEYGMPCVRFPAAYSYTRSGGAGQFMGTVVKDIVIYPDWSQGGDEPIIMVGTEDSFTNQ